MRVLISRIVREKRAILVPLGIALLLNILAYAIVVRPLGVKSRGAANRAAAATVTLRAAERDVALADALVSGKSDADRELSAFYQKVLPSDLIAARRMTYGSLPALARKTRVRYEARTTEIDDGERDAHLGHMTIRMVLAGNYENIRQFLYELESAAEFLIVDDLTLVESNSDEPQMLTVNLSTYYRLGTHAS